MSGTTAPARGEFEVEETQTRDHLGAIDRSWALGLVIDHCETGLDDVTVEL